MTIRSARHYAIFVTLLMLVSQRRVATQLTAPAGPYYVTDLGSLGGAESQALGINRGGQVVGAAQRVDGNTHAFLLTGGTPKDLGTIGGSRGRRCSS